MQLESDQSLRVSARIGAVAAAFVLSICLLSESVALYSRAVFQFIVAGTSDFKQTFFLLWAICVLVAIACGVPQRISTRALLCLLFLPQATAFMTMWVVIRQFALNLSDILCTAAGTRISWSTFEHSHTAKGILNAGVRLLGLERVYTYADPGAGFDLLVPAWLLSVHGLLSLAAGIALISVSRTAVGKFPAKVRLGSLLLWVWGSYGVVKCYIDGGPFAYESLLGTSVVIAILLWREGRGSRAIGIGVAYLIAGLVMTFLVIGHQKRPFTEYFLRGVPFNLLFLALLFSLGIRGGGARGIFAKLFGIAALAFITRDFHFAATLGYLNLKLEAADTLFVKMPADRNFELPLLAKEGGMAFRSGAAGRFESVEEIHRVAQLPPYYALVQVEGKTCKSEVVNHYRQRIFPIGAASESTAVEVPLAGSKLFTDFSVEPCVSPEKCLFRIDYSLNDCIPNRLQDAAVAHLNELGFRNFLLVGERRRY